MPAVDVSLSDRIKRLQELCEELSVTLTLTYDPEDEYWVGWIGDEEHTLEGESLEELVEALETELEH